MSGETEQIVYIGHYRLVRHLGSGGMGEVYLAEDTRLDRPVALKLLPKAVQEDASRRKRFFAEAKAASALNNANVCTIYEVGETADGRLFIAMEYLEGQALDAVARQRRLELPEIAGIGVQVAEALEEARQHQVVHRDIKPANIVVDAQGRVKVLDFGLAKRLDQPLDASTLTQAGTMVGTVNYLSPEMVLGREADTRTDIFSLGVVLYELAAGKNPFAGATLGETISTILNEEPPPLRPWNPRVTSEFERIVCKCLEKDVEKRYATPAQLRDELAVTQARLQKPPRLNRAILGAAAAVLALGVLAFGAMWLMRSGRGPRATAAAQPKSVAVLPFVNMSADKADEYLSDGVTEEVLNALVKVKGLRVPARTSCFVFKGRTDSIRTIGEQLQVGAVLEGSVRKAGNQLRITAQLINVADGFHLWSESYDRDMTNIFAIQSDIASRVAQALQVQLLGAAREPTQDIEAYKLYLQGRYLWNRRTGESIKQAIEYFNQAIAIDPRYALAYAGLADCYQVLPNYLPVGPREVEAQSRAAARKALELDATLPGPLATLASLKETYDWDWRGAEADYRRAIALDPNYATARQWFAESLSFQGRFEEAKGEARKALELDPLSPVIIAVMARVLGGAGGTDEAIDLLRKHIAFDPSFALAHAMLGWAFVSQDKIAEAIPEFEQASRLNENAPSGELGFCYARAGRTNEAHTVLEQLTQSQRQGRDMNVALAMVQHGLGADSLAFDHLEKAVQEHSYFLQLIPVNPCWQDVRAHPRFQAILRKMNLVK